MKKLFAKTDKWLFALMLIYMVLGLIMIFSSSSVSTVLRYNVDPHHFFIRQLIFLIGSFIVGIFIVLRLPTSRYRHFSGMAILLIVVALIGLFVYGKITNGAQGWYDLGFFSLQPSEFAKSILIIFMAVFYERLARKRVNNVALYFIPLAVAALIIILVLGQPDFGGAVILFCIAFGIFMSVPTIKNNATKVIKFLVIGAVILVVGLLYSGSEILNSAQLRRFTFKDPCERYTESTGYQVCNGFIAIHNGGLWGVGLGNSTQKYLYLPESHTDFIFPIIVEELGLIVSIIIIIGYVFMLYRILKIAKEAENLRCSIIAYGVFIYIAIHLLINLLGILALIPLTGVPLPLLSYGGSYTINVVVMLFVVQRVAIENKINKSKKELQNL